jgi:hypothetical protein
LKALIFSSKYNSSYYNEVKKMIIRKKERKNTKQMEYDGERKHGLPHGKGIEKSDNGYYYEGGFINGEKHGCGILKIDKLNFITIHEKGRLVMKFNGLNSTRNDVVIV